MPAQRTTPSRPVLPSTKLLLATLISWGLGMLCFLIAWWWNPSDPDLVLTVFTVLMVFAVILCSLATILAAVGFFKYRRKKLGNLALILISVLTNPVVLLLFLVVFLRGEAV